MSRKKSLIAFAVCFLSLAGVFFILPQDFNLNINNIFNRVAYLNPFLAFTPPGLSMEETIFSGEIELAPDSFAEEDSSNRTDETSTEDMTGVGGPDPALMLEDQELLDDIAEKLDIIKQQISELVEEYNLKNDLDQNLENDELEPLKPEDQQQEEQEEQNDQPKIEDENNDDQIQQPINPPINPPSTTISGGGSKPVYPKILISEIQIAGLTEEKEEFVELYNPNNEELALTGWYLHRKTETGSDYSTFVSKTLFSGKRIGAMGYFLIAREESSFAGLADIITDSSLGNNASSSALALKNPNGEISDKVGFGLAQDFESAPAVNPEKGQSIGRKWDTINNIEQDTDNNLADFEAQNSTPKALNSVYVAPVPENPPLPPEPIPTDTTAPEAIFTLDAIQTSLTFTINFEIADIIGTVTPSGIASYIFQWQEEGGNWQEDPEQKIVGSPTSYNSIREFIEGLDEKTYYFQIKVKDIAGNESAWLPETPVSTKISIPKKVLINEIQIEGVTVKDEFIELYNPNDFDVNLSGFALKKKTASGSESNLVSSDKFLGIISALSYFLIIPQDNDDGTLNYTGQGIPDLHYSGKSYSVAENNTVLLYNNYDDLLDKVGFGSTSDFETAPASNPDKGQSIVRKELGVDTDDNSQDFIIFDIPISTGD